jgi:ketosteroid isomerase-like protein
MTAPAREYVERFMAVAAASEDRAALRPLLDPEVVWFGTRGGLDESRVMRGPDAVIAYMREISEPWSNLRFEIEETVEAGDAVVLLLREVGRSRHGGPEVQNATAMIFRVRDGRILEMTGYLDRDEALRAAGVD